MSKQAAPESAIADLAATVPPASGKAAPAKTATSPAKSATTPAKATTSPTKAATAPAKKAVAPTKGTTADAATVDVSAAADVIEDDPPAKKDAKDSKAKDKKRPVVIKEKNYVNSWTNICSIFMFFISFFTAFFVNEDDLSTACVKSIFVLIVSNIFAKALTLVWQLAIPKDQWLLLVHGAPPIDSRSVKRQTILDNLAATEMEEDMEDEE